MYELGKPNAMKERANCVSEKKTNEFREKKQIE